MNKKWNRPTTDGKGNNTKLYLVWKGIKNRCFNTKSKDYLNYGGRGITLCVEWTSFDEFFDWAMGNGYKEGLEIDRKDNKVSYCPSNCRFVSREVNQLNKRVVGKSKFRGVHPHRKLNKFIASIYHKGKTRYIGTFNEEIEAAKAFDLKAIELRGVNAVLNFKAP